MIALQFLSLVFGVALVLAVLGSNTRDCRAAQRGSRPSQAVFATTYGLLVHRRNSVQARWLRSTLRARLARQPAAGLDDRHGHRVHVRVLGHGQRGVPAGLRARPRSSLTTLGFSEAPSGTGKIVIAFVEATIGLGLVALLISFLPTIYTAYNGREKGINRLRPVAGAPPNATRAPAQTLRRIGAFEGAIDFWRSQADLCSIWSRPTPPSLPHLLPRDAHGPLLGRHGRVPARLRRTLVSRRPTTRGRGLPGRREGAHHGRRLRPPLDRAHRPRRQRPAPPSRDSPT